MITRVLFVDDEVLILNGIKRMLWEADSPWQCKFVTSGAEALGALREGPFDVVVTDMRMPGMDGARLLTEVSQQYPDVVRIILSGFAEEESILRTAGPAHQYLSKPCQTDALITTIDRSVALRRFLADENFRRFIGGLASLPSLPEVYTAFQKELENPASNPKSLARIITRDVALTAETLKLTNSAYFGLPRPIERLEQAVSILGTDTLRSLLLIAGFYTKFVGSAETLARITALSGKSLEIGLMARQVARFLGLEAIAVEQASCAGILSHVGTLAMLSNAEACLDEALSLLDPNSCSIVDAERTVLKASHQEIGAYLLGLWGFTDPILEAVAFHHEPSRAGAKIRSPLTAVHIAQAMLSATTDTRETDLAGGSLADLEYLRALSLEDNLEQLARDAGIAVD